MLLAIDTSTAATVVAFCDVQGTALWVAPSQAVGRHGDHLLSHVEAGLATLGKAPADVTVLAVGVGPGSFTGLRIGLATAQGWALALGTPAYGVLSPLAIAAPLLAGGAGGVAVIGDAFKGEVALSVFAAEPGAAPRLRASPRAMAPEAVAGELQGLGLAGRVVAVGDGLRRHAEAIGLSALPHITVAEPRYDRPDGAALAQAALLARASGDPGAAETLLPHYVRDADAQLPKTPLKL